MASSSSTTAVRSWRTAFLTLRDETLTSHSPHARGGASSSSSSSSIHQLLHQLIFSHSQSFISAAPQLPPHEVLSLSVVVFQICSKITSMNLNIMMIWLGYLRPLVSAGIGECSRPTRWYHWYLYSYFTLGTYLWFSCLLLLLFNSHSLFLVLLLPNILYFLSQIHDVCLRVSFDLNPSSWTLILDSFTKMLVIC